MFVEYIMPSLCQFENCRIRACYALYFGKPDRCKEHKEDRKPQAKVCLCGESSPSFNYMGEKTSMCCKKCKEPTMIDVKNIHRCACGKRALFNDPNENNPICCGSCKSGSMVNICKKLCICTASGPLYNEVGETIPICCSLCKSPSMVNVISKLCLCKARRPSFNEPSHPNPICCSLCKTPSMINVICKARCLCKKTIPRFALPEDTMATCCSSCKLPHMINISHVKRCYCGKSQPNFDEPGVKVAKYCVKCKSDSMIDIMTKKCKGQDGTCTITGNKKYKGYCTFCFSNMFPTDPLTYQIRSKTKEIATRDFINDHFEGFSHDKPIYTAHCDCSIRRRIDHRKLIGNTMLAVETDESQHKSYDEMDEEIRYDDLFNAFSGKWVYIRFNPDKFRNKAGVSKNPTIATRLIELKTEMERQIQRIEAEENTELLEIKYMYYDGYA